MSFSFVFSLFVLKFMSGVWSGWVYSFVGFDSLFFFPSETKITCLYCASSFFFLFLIVFISVHIFVVSFFLLSRNKEEKYKVRLGFVSFTFVWWVQKLSFLEFSMAHEL
ncbi:hypothetical protein ACOSQ4_014516 [Xanthoceras sorbifolium]